MYGSKLLQISVEAETFYTGTYLSVVFTLGFLGWLTSLVHFPLVSPQWHLVECVATLLRWFGSDLDDLMFLCRSLMSFHNADNV